MRNVRVEILFFNMADEEIHRGENEVRNSGDFVFRYLIIKVNFLIIRIYFVGWRGGRLQVD